MLPPIPEEWKVDPPTTLVAGSGPVAGALAFILNAARLPPLDGLAPYPTSEAVPRVLEDLERILLVVSGGHSPADAIRQADRLWTIVEGISSRGPDHDLAFLFVLPPHATAMFADSLALGFALKPAEFPGAGHNVWRVTEPLAVLLERIAETVPRDLVLLRARRRADHRRNCLTAWRRAIEREDADALPEVSWSVLEAFRGREHDLDLFATPPHHGNGNQLRQWLQRLVTGQVTPEVRKEALLSIPALLDLHP